MLLVDASALGVVDLLNLLDEVLLHPANTGDAQDVLRVSGTTHELLTCGNPHSVTNDTVSAVEVELETGTARQNVLHVLLAVVTYQDELATVVRLVDADDTSGLGQRRLALRATGLEELDDTGKTLGDVVTSDTTGVEGTHRQLGTRLTNRLSSDDADGLTDVNQVTGRQ